MEKDKLYSGEENIRSKFSNEDPKTHDLKKWFGSKLSLRHDNSNDIQDQDSSKYPPIEPTSNASRSDTLKPPVISIFKDISNIDVPTDSFDPGDNIYDNSATNNSTRKFICPSLTSSSDESSRAVSFNEPEVISKSSDDHSMNTLPSISFSDKSNIVDNSLLDIFVKEPGEAQNSSDAWKIEEGRSCNRKGLDLTVIEKFKDAKMYFKMGAHHDNKAACYNLGICYHFGRGVDPNADKAATYYDQAATARALYNLSLLILSGQLKKYDERFVRENGMICLKAAADLGLAVAQNLLAVLYTEACDYVDAVKYFRKAAEQQHPNALYHLGVCYQMGYGVDVNWPRAAELYRDASFKNHPAAQHNLAVFFENGFGGLPVSERTALRWYTTAKDNGNYSSRDCIDRIQENMDEVMGQKEYR